MRPHIAHDVTLPDNEDDLLAEWGPWIDRQVGVFHVRYSDLIELDDLRQEACIGFLQAARSWDPAKGCPFKTWALKRMTGQVVDELRHRDPVSRNERTNIERLLAGDETLTDLQVKRAQRANLHTRPPMSLDADNTFEESLADMSPDVLDGLVKADTVQEVLDALSTLRPNERQVVEMYFLEGHSLHSIGLWFGFTESRASKLKTIGLAKLRKVVDSTTCLLAA